MHESTMDGLNNLYPKLSSGGCCIVDDYMIPGCRKAIGDYRQAHHITEPIRDIDGWAVDWRKAAAW